VEKIVEKHPQYDYILSLIENKHEVGDISALAEAIQKLFNIIEGAALADYVAYREHSVIRYSIASLIPSVAFIIAHVMEAPAAYLWVIAGTSIGLYATAGWYWYGTRFALYRIYQTSQFRKTEMLRQYLENLGYETVVEYGSEKSPSNTPVAVPAL
jgi:hypothetical protein